MFTNFKNASKEFDKISLIEFSKEILRYIRGSFLESLIGDPIDVIKLEIRAREAVEDRLVNILTMLSFENEQMVRNHLQVDFSHMGMLNYVSSGHRLATFGSFYPNSNKIVLNFSLIYYFFPDCYEDALMSIFAHEIRHACQYEENYNNIRDDRSPSSGQNGFDFQDYRNNIFEVDAREFQKHYVYRNNGNNPFVCKRLINFVDKGEIF